MSLTFKEAVDDVNAMFLEAVQPLGYTIHWEAVAVDRQPGTNPFFMFITRHAAGRQDTLGGVGHRSFQRLGTSVASIYTPVGKGLSESYALAKTVADAYEGKTSQNGVWFRNVRIQEIGRDGEFYQTNVLVDFEYYETK